MHLKASMGKRSGEDRDGLDTATPDKKAKRAKKSKEHKRKKERKEKKRKKSEKEQQKFTVAN